jgi:RNA polymerase sigma-70 factor (ECF subfamily)
MELKKKPSEASVAEGLVQRIIDDDRNAEREMVERYHRGLVVMLYNRSRDRSLAEDIAQDTWIIVIQKIRGQQLRDQRKLAAFIIQIGKNQLIMNYRARDRHQHVSDDEVLEHADQAPSPEQQMSNQQLGQTLDELLAAMSTTRDPEILRRFYLIGDSKTELCNAYNLNEAHFDRVLFRARERFKKLWASHRMRNST